MKEEWIEYNSVPNQYSNPGQIPLDPYCNGLTVKNGGNTLLLFQGETLQPQESKAIGGNRKELFRGRIDIDFALPTPAPPTPINLAIVTQKVYVNICE